MGCNRSSSREPFLCRVEPLRHSANRSECAVLLLSRINGGRELLCLIDGSCKLLRCVQQQVCVTRAPKLFEGRLTAAVCRGKALQDALANLARGGPLSEDGEEGYNVAGDAFLHVARFLEPFFALEDERLLDAAFTSVLDGNADLRCVQSRVVSLAPVGDWADPEEPVCCKHPVSLHAIGFCEQCGCLLHTFFVHVGFASLINGRLKSGDIQREGIILRQRLERKLCTSTSRQGLIVSVPRPN